MTRLSAFSGTAIAAVLTLTLTACGSSADGSSDDAEPTTSATSATPATEAPVTEDASTAPETPAGGSGSSAGDDQMLLDGEVFDVTASCSTIGIVNVEITWVENPQVSLFLEGFANGKATATVTFADGSNIVEGTDGAWDPGSGTLTLPAFTATVTRDRVTASGTLTEDGDSVAVEANVACD